MPEGRTWLEVVKESFRTTGKAAKEWWATPSADPLPENFQERLGKDISMLDLFPGGAGVGALTRKAAVGQAARSWRALLRGTPKNVKRGLLEAERTSMTKALAKMPEESLASMREVSVIPRQTSTKAAMGYKGKYAKRLYWFAGQKLPTCWEFIDKDPLEVIAHEVLGHLQALNPKEAGKLKSYFREINRALGKDPAAHEKFAGRVGELTERYHKVKPGPMTLEDVKLITEMATTEQAWTPSLAPFLRPTGR